MQRLPKRLICCRRAVCGGAALAAWASAARANVVGGDLQNFNAVPGGIDYVTVQASETLEPGILNLSLMVNHAVNSLPYYEDQDQNRFRYNDALTMADFGVGYGLAENTEVGFAAQDLLEQHTSEGDNHSEFSSPGVTNYRFYGKYRVLADSPVGVAVVGTVDFNRVLDNPMVGTGGSPIGIGEVAVDTKAFGVSVAGNVGYRFRHKGGQIPGMQLHPMGNQYIGSVGMSYLLPSLDTKLITEVFGSRPAHSDITGDEVRQSSSAELLVGVKFDATNALAVHVGGGTELIRGAATPDWRVYGGFNYALGPIGRDAPVVEHSRYYPPQARPKKAPEERTILENVHFATGSDQVPPEAAEALAVVGKEIKASTYDAVVVEGHTDSVGRAASNQKLSERRAKTVRAWLIEHAGIDASKITAVGYGDTRPIADNGNFQGRQRNRRVEIKVMRNGGQTGTSESGAAAPEAPAKGK